MAVTAAEKIDSRSVVRGLSATAKYIIRGTDTYTTALSTLTSQHSTDGSPGSDLGIAGLNIENIRAEYEVLPVFIDTENVANCIWDGEIRYRFVSGAYNASFDGDEAMANWGFDFSTRTEKVTQSKDTIVSPAGSPDFNGAIDYDGEKINGADVLVPEFRFHINKVFSDFTLANAADLSSSVGTVNSAAFQGFDAGNVLCLPPTGQRDGKSGNWIITYNFAYKPATTGTVGGITLTESIPGWWKVWIWYEEDEDDPLLFKKPQYVYGEQVYNTTNFNNLPGMS